MSRKKLTTEEFIEKAREIHGNLYDYSLVEYKRSNIKIKIICLEHGIFEQIPNSHLNGKSCSKCGGNKKSTTEEFIEQSKLIHGEKYDYSLVEYKGNKIKVKIFCKKEKHGCFFQKPNTHLNGTGCPKCFGKQQLTTKEFIEKAIQIHGNEYDYSLVDYKRSNIEVKIFCKIHGVFKQKPSNHLQKHGCPKCYGIKKLTTEEFIIKANIVHNNRYDYLNVKYVNALTKIEIICKKHDVFIQTPNSHLNGIGCPKCGNNSVSKKETQWLDYEKVPMQNRNKPVYIKDQKFIPDIFDSNDINPKTKCTYGELYQKTIDRLKLFRENGYKVIFIWESEFKNLLKFNKTFNII